MIKISASVILLHSLFYFCGLQGGLTARGGSRVMTAAAYPADSWVSPQQISITSSITSPNGVYTLTFASKRYE